MNNKNVYLIAGPNGAGKTTFARMFLPTYAKCPNFINADLIAQGLSPFSPEIASIKAGRLVLEQISKFTHENVDFGFETTLSGKTYMNLLKELKKQGYKVNLFFLWIPGSELALARIKNRVAEGGHNIPSQDVYRRFSRSIFNFFHYYMPLLDSWMLFDNSGSVPKLIAEYKNNKTNISDKTLYGQIGNIR